MGKQAEIPCAACQSWHKKQKKFSCNPDTCSALTTWLFANASQMHTPTTQMQAALPQIALQYVV